MSIIEIPSLGMVVITPEIAEEMLRKNISNRPLNSRHVDNLSEQMRRGKWVSNGESIKFSSSRLVDGQHRLRAIINSGASVEMLVVGDLPDDSFKTIDVGRFRTSEDTLYEMGIPNPKIVAPAIKLVHKYETDNLRNDFGGTRPLLHDELINKLDENKDIIESARFIRSQQLPPKWGGQSVFTALHYLFWRRSTRDIADKFMDKIISGEMLEGDSPILVARNRLERIKSDTKRHVHRYERHAIIIKAWNLFRQDKTAKNISWDKTQKFPSII